MCSIRVVTTSRSKHGFPFGSSGGPSSSGIIPSNIRWSSCISSRRSSERPKDAAGRSNTTTTTTVSGSRNSSTSGHICSCISNSSTIGDSKGTDCILDVRVTDTDATSYALKPSDKVLEAAEKLKKKKYLQACLEHRRHFTPFVVSVNGILGKYANTFLKVLAVHTATEAGKSYSNAMGHLRARMIIVIVRATHVCLRGSHIPTSQMCNRRPQWDDLAGMALLKH
jgi:hypothetical protein